MKSNILYLLILTVLTSSCSDEFLNLAPEYQNNESSFYKTEQDFETAIIGNYSELQTVYNASILYLTELTTDNSEITWTSPVTSETECDELNLTSNNQYVNSVWNSSFKTISRSNTILKKVEEAELNSDVKTHFSGEAHFLRAFSYFNLVRLFGEIPIVTEAFSSPEAINTSDMSRKSIDEVYLLIIEDLEKAIVELQGVDIIKSRASVGAATALLGKVYLTQKNFSKAEIELRKVIDSKEYDLEAEYKKLFSIGNDHLNESIFEIEFLSGNLGEGNLYSNLFTPPSFNMAIFPGNMAGHGRIVPTKDISNAYEDGDLRKSASIMDSLKLIGGGYEQTQYGLKFVDFSTGLQGDGGINFTVLRYADVLLMYAEALNEAGKTDDALNYLNQVRNRAGLPSVADLDQIGFKLKLENERRVEFLSEGHRWFDLVRTGRAAEVINDYFSRSGLSFTISPNEVLMPIPQREIDINPTLGQNEGY